VVCIFPGISRLPSVNEIAPIVERYHRLDCRCEAAGGAEVYKGLKDPRHHLALVDWAVVFGMGQSYMEKSGYFSLSDRQVGSPGWCSAEYLPQFRNHKGIVVQNAFGATEGDRPLGVNLIQSGRAWGRTVALGVALGELAFSSFGGGRPSSALASTGMGGPAAAAVAETSVAAAAHTAGVIGRASPSLVDRELRQMTGLT
jgi:hypothetical protein